MPEKGGILCQRKEEYYARGRRNALPGEGGMLCQREEECKVRGRKNVEPPLLN
jgi:hypothetical protein